MRHKHLFLIWLAIMFVAFSCKKEDLPPSNIGNPVFTSDFSFDGNPYQLVAGVDGLSMQVETYFDGDTVFFESAIDSPVCDSCGPALYVQLISPDLISAWGNQAFESKLSNWDYAFAQNMGTDTTLSVFTTSTGGPGVWSLNGTPQSPQALSTFQFEIENYGDYEIKLQSNNPACGQPAFQNFEFYGDLPCFVNLASSALDTLFTVQPGGAFNLGNLAYTWFYNDTTVNTTVPTLYMPNLGQSEQMCVTVTEQGGCTESVCINLSNNINECLTNFRIDSMQVLNGITFIENALMRITFIDIDNVAFTSSNQMADQPSFTAIQLLEATPYTEPTAPSRSFIKAKYSIQCMLYDALGNGKIFNGIVETAFEDPGL